MSLTIGKLRNRFYSDIELDAARCQDWQTLLAEQDSHALTDGLVGPDEWLLIRHLKLDMQWHIHSSDAEVQQQWRDRLRQQLEQAKQQPQQQDVIFYPHRRVALADLLYRSATGDCSRQWAWQQMGLIQRHPLSPEHALEQGVAHLLREPSLIWPVLQRLIQAEADTAALTTTLRSLPAPHWHSLLKCCPQTAAYQALLEQALHTLSPPLDTPSSPAYRALLSWIEHRSHFAACYTRILLPLLAAIHTPALGLSTAWLQTCLSQVQRDFHHAIGTTLYTLNSIVLPAAAIQPLADDATPLPPLPELSEWQHTAWAGALFWLGRLPSTQVTPAWLRALADALGIPVDDAAYRAFCGGEVWQGELSDQVQQSVQQQIAHWSDWLAQHATDLPEPRLHFINQRPGKLRIEPGWIELHLAMDTVHTTIRRLGLDLDPGWLPCLGCVVRIIYEE